MKIDVFFTPLGLNAGDLSGRGVIVVDVLRTTTSIVTALANGAKAVVPASTSEEAVRLTANLEKNGYVLAGERKSLKIEGFALGNSPREMTPDAVGGKTIYFSTTNGTPALVAAQGGGAQPRQGAQAIEGRQRPADPQKGDQHGPGADAVPQQPAQALAPVAGDVPGQQREPEKEASHQRPDPDELLPRLRRHATMRRSTKEGTTVKRSALALNATSSPRVTPRSSRAASEASSAAAQPA